VAASANGSGTIDDDVVDLRWPAQAAARDELARRGVPRLLIVDHGVDPPWSDGLEDWVRPDADVVERYVRREGLRRQAAVRAPASIDGDGLLHRGSRWVALPPGELVAMTALLSEPGYLVARAELAAALQATGSLDGAWSVDNVVKRVRKRIAPLGMAVCAVRGLGFLLEVGELPV
jgi:hypothetical protein